VALSPEQQEHYARHLLLDELGGAGQERLLAAAVRVEGSGVAARWAARYLAASGVGRLEVDPAFAGECRALGPWLKLGGPATLSIAPRDAETSARSAMSGAQAALEALRALTS
jgi:hypothetical protein